jgi:hypothetical protein
MATTPNQMILLKINDTDSAIRKSIDFLSNKTCSDMEVMSYETAFNMIKNELFLISTKPEPERTTKLYNLLDFRQQIYRESDGKNNPSAKSISARIALIFDISKLKKKAAKPIYVLLAKSIDFLQHYLINESAITPMGSYLPHTNFLEKDLIETSTWKIFPEFQKFWLLLRSPTTANQYRNIMPLKWGELYDTHIGKYGYTNAGNSVNCWRKVALKTNTSQFAEIDDLVLKKYRDSTPNDAALPWSNLIPLLNEMGAKIDQSSISIVSTYDNQNTKNIKENVFDSLAYRLESSDFVRDSYPQLFETVGTKKAKHVITRKAQIQAIIEIDDWYITKSKLTNFTVSELATSHPNSPWIKSQLEYINSLQEHGTKKNTRNALRDLNIYLFSYLSHFFAKNDALPYRYPVSPSDFKAAIYIHTSDIVNQSLYGENDIYPESFIDFFKELNSDAAPESTQSKLHRIKRYFEYCSTHYTGIEGYEILSNPISSIIFSKVKARSYRNRSVKEVLEIEYWLLFSEYLISVADKLVQMVEHSIPVPYRGATSIPLSGKIKALDYEIELSDSLPMNLKRIKREGEIKRIRSKSNSNFYLEIQSTLALCIMASSGLRSANVMWLDCENWDSIDERPDGYSGIWVATDKAKTKGFDSLVRSETYKIMKRFESIRESLDNSTKNLIPYQNEETSKWGEIKPFLGTGTTNTAYEIQLSETLTQLLVDFEHQLFKNNLDLGTYTFYGPVYRNIESRSSLFTHTKTGMFVTDSEMTALHLENEPARLFTAIELTTLVTPHSLRKTIDTHLSLILGANFVGGLLTGQTESTVNYYSEVTPARYEKIIAIRDKIQLPKVMTVQDTAKCADDIKKSFSDFGLQGLSGFRLAVKSVDDSKIPVVNINDIAINSTHICIYGNDCPKEILVLIGGKKKCGICPVAISTASDLIPISAQIRFHADNISDYTKQLSIKNINPNEKNALIKKRIEECDQAASWYARHEFIRRATTAPNGFITLEDGRDRVQRTIQAISGIDQGSALYCRLKEVDSFPSLQSERLKRTANRVSRKILNHLKQENFELPDIDPVGIAVGLIAKVANMHSFSSDHIKVLLDEAASPPNNLTNSPFEDWLIGP